MSGRDRSTKARAQRIDRQYFQRISPFQRWRWALVIAAVGLSGLWIGVHSVRGSNTIYSPGPLSKPHVMLNQKCAVCHTGAGPFETSVTDQSCAVCHDGAIHQSRQSFTPHCVNCHGDHTPDGLRAVGDRECVVCHADLKVKTGESKVDAHIHAFAGDHPEFRPLRLGTKDPGKIKFNHAVHLKKDLRSPDGNVSLSCSDCHRTDNREPWPYGTTDESAAASTGTKYMGQVNYYEHCSKCHPLTFDPRFSASVPHKDPDVVHDFLAKKFTAWIAAHPEELRQASRVTVRLPEAIPAASPASAQEWIAIRMYEAEQLLRVKTCKECHNVAPADRGIPSIEKANLASRWLTRSEFDHSAHQMLVCVTCHGAATKSTKTSDVLLPGIAVCRECHVSGKQDAASGNCVECHVYHDPARRKHVEGKFTAEQISVGH